jgi:hypothetical protein
MTLFSIPSRSPTSCYILLMRFVASPRCEPSEVLIYVADVACMTIAAISRPPFWFHGVAQTFFVAMQNVLTYFVTLVGRRVEWRSFTNPHAGSQFHYVVACNPSIRLRNSRPESLSLNSPCRHASRLVLAWSIIFRSLTCPSVRTGCKICRVSTTRSNLFSISILSAFQATSAWSKGLYNASTPLTIVFSRLNGELASRRTRWPNVTYESLSPAPTPWSTSMLSSFSVSTTSVKTGLTTSHIASNRSRSSRLETTKPRHLMA